MPDADRPNLDALRRALDVYRDAMRQFIARELDRAFGEDGATGAAAAALEGQRRAEFETDLREGQSLADALRFDDIPPIVRAHLADAFAESLGGRAGASERLSLIAGADETVMNPPPGGDVDGGEASARIQDAARVLAWVGAREAARDVRRIGRDVKPEDERTGWTDRIPGARLLTGFSGGVGGLFVLKMGDIADGLIHAFGPVVRAGGWAVEFFANIATIEAAPPWVVALAITVIAGAAAAVVARIGWQRRPAARPPSFGWLAAGARRVRERAVVLASRCPSSCWASRCTSPAWCPTRSPCHSCWCSSGPSRSRGESRGVGP